MRRWSRPTAADAARPPTPLTTPRRTTVGDGRPSLPPCPLPPYRNLLSSPALRRLNTVAQLQPPSTWSPSLAPTTCTATSPEWDAPLSLRPISRLLRKKPQYSCPGQRRSLRAHLQHAYILFRGAGIQ